MNMNSLTKGFLLLLFFSLSAAAMLTTYQMRERVPAPAPRELYKVVECQIAAFRADNFPGAYRYVASAVQQRFTLTQFKSMIRREYGTITQPRRVEFGFVKVHGGDALVQVFFFDEDGMNHPFLYTLVAEDGDWKISGVQPMRSAPRVHQFSGLRV